MIWREIVICGTHFYYFEVNDIIDMQIRMFFVFLNINIKVFRHVFRN